jgi:hypothetical protein
MAGNRVKALGRQLYTFPTNGGATSGAPCRIGDLPGVALVDLDTYSGTTVDFEGVYALNVAGLDDNGNSAVAVGDSIFYVDADTPKLSKKAAAGRFFGTAVGPSSGAFDTGAAVATLVVAGVTTTTIAVRIGPAPGVAGGLNTIGTTAIGAGTVTTADIGALAVTTALINNLAVTTGKIAAAAVTGPKLPTGLLHITLADGTIGATNVTVAGMAATDEIVSVLSFTTKVAIASVADRTSEYAAGAGVATKAAGTIETGNQLVIVWMSHT